MTCNAFWDGPQLPQPIPAQYRSSSFASPHPPQKELVITLAVLVLTGFLWLLIRLLRWLAVVVGSVLFVISPAVFVVLLILGALCIFTNLP